MYQYKIKIITENSEHYQNLSNELFTVFYFVSILNTKKMGYNALYTYCT